MDGSGAMIVVIVAAILVISVFFSFVPIGLWVSAAAAGVRVSIFYLVGMRLRRVARSESSTR